MNSLNLLSSRVIGAAATSENQRDRPRSYSEGNLKNLNTDSPLKRTASQHAKRANSSLLGQSSNPASSPDNDSDNSETVEGDEDEADEKIPLLGISKPSTDPRSRSSWVRVVTRRLANAIVASLKIILSTLAVPGSYFVAGFYDEKGHFSLVAPIRKLSRISFGQQVRNPKGAGGIGSFENEKPSPRRKVTAKDAKRKKKNQKGAIDTKSESDGDTDEKLSLSDIPADSRPSIQTSSSSDEVPQARRSIRIRSYNEDTTRRRKQHRDREGNSQEDIGASNDSNKPKLTLENIKSPTSPAVSLRITKYPKGPAPPRPLIPQRQPSYSLPLPSTSRFSKKTLVIDLDETLIHSLAKGGRMSSGHMVEVKLNTTVGVGGATLGPQHPILYYVHKRPHCDEFLRRVYKWYNLVVFTASVQEYADPVIDWLEQERKYFSSRYYRQHCTFRNGAYIKDLSSVEPDLSKVMILDNSPLSYIFHEDNAIPIEGWINDPTDNDLLHLVPMLEALQYVTDVRALLALRRGEGSVPL